MGYDIFFTLLIGLATAGLKLGLDTPDQCTKGLVDKMSVGCGFRR